MHVERRDADWSDQCNRLNERRNELFLNIESWKALGYYQRLVDPSRAALLDNCSELLKRVTEMRVWLRNQPQVSSVERTRGPGNPPSSRHSASAARLRPGLAPQLPSTSFSPSPPCTSPVGFENTPVETVELPRTATTCQPRDVPAPQGSQLTTDPLLTDMNTVSSRSSVITPPCAFIQSGQSTSATAVPSTAPESVLHPMLSSQPRYDGRSVTPSAVWFLPPVDASRDAQLAQLPVMPQEVWGAHGLTELEGILETMGDPNASGLPVHASGVETNPTYEGVAANRAAYRKSGKQVILAFTIMNGM